MLAIFINMIVIITIIIIIFILLFFFGGKNSFESKTKNTTISSR